jgi:hypothetical protein
VEWSGVEWSGLQATHVLSRERTKYHFTKPHTVYNLTSVCFVLIFVVVVLREEKKLQEFIGNTQFDDFLYFVRMQ